MIYRENEKLAAFVKAHQTDPRLAGITPKTVLDASTKSRATTDAEAIAYLDKVWAIRAEILNDEAANSSSGHFVGTFRIDKDEREIAHSCGSAERAYRARLGQTLMTRTLPGIPHEDYRVLVMTTAFRRSSRPTTRDLALAKAQVDKMLVDRGLGVVIPHSKPGRVTR
jgi:hypothetical protein